MKTIIENPLIADGSGKEMFKADVLIEDDRIIDVGHFSSNIRCSEKINANGLILCPGFMDMHAHSDLEILRDPRMMHKTGQGITFDLSGNCGVGVFPREKDDPSAFADILGLYENWDWTDYASYRNKINSPFNIAFLQSHAMLRMSAIEGNPNRIATKSEVKKMCCLLEQSLEQGCIGLSSGLYYAPNMYADSNEITELLKVIKKTDTLFCVHHRCEGDFILDSIDEVISYALKTGVRLEISHLKAIGVKNQNKVDSVLEKIHKAYDSGLQISFDQYPYEYGSTSLYSLLPPSYLKLRTSELKNTLREALKETETRRKLIEEIENPDGWDSVIELCGFDNIKVAVLSSNIQFQGLTLNQCADLLHCDPYSALFRFLIDETGSALMFDITQSTENLIKIMKDPLMCFGTDALYTGSAAHPRSSSAAIHILDYFCKRTPVFKWEELICKMTSKVAERVRIKDRGTLTKGKKADLVLLNPDTLKDNSTPDRPYNPCSGLEMVMINGIKVLDT